ncbi:MAG: HAD-IA family hydrolase, partial [Alphaproteobacteria bacterium]|nr:HAD-IA family hydrolase [Alphaproteobacteria bacterium]
MSNNKIKAIIFDVDGVILKSHDERGNYLWSRSIKEDLGLTSKHFSVIFSEKWDSIIRGKIDLGEHLHAIFQEELFKELTITPQQYIQYWLSRDHHVNQDILHLVESLKTPCYLGTNQESLRITHILNTVGSYFKECFVSYKIGFIKPEQGFFQHIEKALSLLPHELLLIDDTRNNT